MSAHHDDALDAAYERLLTTGPEYGGFLSNHAPMVVEAMAHHGFDEQIHPWLDRYIGRLEPRPAASGRIDDWRAALGDRARVGDWLEHLEHEVDGTPWDAVLARWWPRLAPGIIGGAAHGAIRVGHAVRALQQRDTPVRRRELGAALGYWAACYRLIPTSRPAGALAPIEALAGVPPVPDRSAGSGHRITQLTRTPGWHDALAALQPASGPAGLLARTGAVVDAAALRYLTHGHGDGVMLVHSVTAPTAVLRVMPAVPTDHWEVSADLAWIASAALNAAYMPDDAWPGAPRQLDAAELMAEAVAHGDEHVIKLADAVVEAHARTGDPRLLAAGARSLDLVPSPARV